MTRTIRRLGAALILAALLGEGRSGYAEELAPTVQKLPRMDVKEILPADVAYAPGAASSLSEQEIEDYRPYTLHDALDFVPGVRTIDDDVLGRRSGIGIRGSAPRRSRQILLLEDGVPIQAATYLDPSGHYTPPLERLERIDVLKGAGQIIHGPLNNHGIINFRNKRPTPYPETIAGVGVGNLGTLKRNFLHRQTRGDFGIVLSYAGMDADGAFDSEEHRFDDFFGSLDWALHEKHDLSLSFTYFRERSNYDERNLTLEEFAEAPRSKLRLNRGAEFNNISVDYFKGALAHTFRASDRLTFSSKLFGTYLDRPRFESRDGGPAQDGFMVGRIRDYRTLGAESRLEYTDVTFLGTRHTFQAGLRMERQLFSDENAVGRIGEVLDESNRGNIFAMRNVDGFGADGRRTFLHASAVSAFVQDVIRVGDFIITPGLRAEWYKQVRNLKFRPGRETGEEADENVLLLPGLSFLYDGLPASQIYAGVHRGYSPAIARTEDFPLVPETGINSQIGLRSRYFKGVTFEVAGFYNLLQNTLVRKTVTDEFGLNIFVNSGDSEARGVDVGLRVDSLAFTASRLNAFAQVAYNYTESRFTNGPLEGNRVPEIPLHAGSLTVGLEHTSGWQISGTVSHFGRFFTDAENTKPLSTPDPGEPLEVVGEVPSHTLYSARASYTIPNTRVTLWVQGRNLTNKLYITDVQDGLRPGAERTVMGGVQIAFY